MRLFLGGVAVGCLSSAGALLAHSLSSSPSSDTTPSTPLPTTPTPALVLHPLEPPAPLPPMPEKTSHHIETATTTTTTPPSTTTTNPPSTTTTATARTEEILSHGWPSGGRVRKAYSNHVLEYDCARRIPMWVAEHLTQDLLKGKAARSKAKFRSDLDLPLECRAYNSDYKRSGWSRGHMAPAADSKAWQGAMDDTFLLSNILPQDIDNNSGFWNRLEIFCRDLTQRYQDVWVTSGPVFMPTVTPVEEGGDGKKRVTYEVIGESEVAVPTHLYKVVVAKTGAQVATGAFIVPNKPLGYEHHLTSFQVPIEHLERKVGVKFYSDLDRSAASDLCQETGCNLVTKGEMDAIIYTSRLWHAGNLDKLSRLWREVKERKVPVTDKLQNAYETKLGELTAAATAEEKENEGVRQQMRSG